MQKHTPPSTPDTPHWRRIRWCLLALLLMLPLYGPSCTGEVLPFLQHFKRPVSMAVATNPTDNILYMYVANADIDRIAMVHIPQRSLLIDPSPTTPGILLIKTGRYPIDVAAAPAQKRIYVLHGIEGNIGAIDLTTNLQVLDNGAPMRLPKGCPGGRCWRSPSRLLLHEDKDNKKLYGIVAIPAEGSIAIVDLTTGAADFGKEIKRFRVQGLPHALLYDEANKLVYVTNSSSQTVNVDATTQRKLSFVHAIDLTQMTLQNIFICESVTESGVLVTPPCGPNGNGAVSPDGRWLYLLDLETSGIRIYDTKEKKVVPQGDKRFPELETIQALDNAAFLSVKFLPPVGLTFKNDSGEDIIISKSYVWASASDGYGYVIDPETHTLVDTDQRGPTVQNLQMYVLDDSIGDPRDPIRKGLPTLRTDNSIDGDTGIKVFDGVTRTEQWTLTYEGLILESSRTGRFSDLAKGEFADAESRDLSLDGVKKGDILLLEDCIPGTATPTTDGGTTPDAATTTAGTPCEFTILELDKHRMVLDVKDKTIPERSAWQFHVRAQAKSFLVKGDIGGILPERLTPGAPYTSPYFALTLNAPTEVTPRDTRIEFSTVSGRVDARILLGGLSNRITSAPSHVGCGSGSNCELETCQQHPSCTNTKCISGSEDTKLQCSTDEDCTDGACIPQQRIWYLDPSSSQIFVVNPKTLRAENTIR